MATSIQHAHQCPILNRRKAQAENKAPIREAKSTVLLPRSQPRSKRIVAVYLVVSLGQGAWTMKLIEFDDDFLALVEALAIGLDHCPVVVDEVGKDMPQGRIAILIDVGG